MNDQTNWQTEYLAEYTRTSGRTATFETSTPRGRYLLITDGPGGTRHTSKHTRKQIQAMTERLRARPSAEEQARIDAERRQ